MRRQMTEAEAYHNYECYCDTHKATKADPLRTFAGWLDKFNVEVVDLEDEFASGKGG